jgi:hypothetical protein
MITIETIINELNSVPEPLLAEVLDFIRSAKDKAVNDPSLKAEKSSLNQSFEKDTRNRLLTQLLENFQTDEISLETINEEVEAVRAELYARQQAS